ncbi:ABC transporter ATP-binding protein [Streptomyces sp. NPDC059582]|uniref:ABC transporter ATP-binding protein n=1 Tax=Streptomyces sp. NPDC059582 TaxID=3346875 RepID=UPI0036BDF95F
MSRFRIAGMTVAFQGVTVVDDVDLSVEAGQVHAVIGPNGAGKTTLLNAATGVIRAVAGHVYIDDAQLRGHSLDSSARQGLSRTFQHSQAFDSLTPLEHVAVAGRVGRDGSERTVDFAHDLVRGLPDRPACELDAWGRRTAELARALAGGPRVLLLDEPAGGLDEEGRRTLAGVLDEIRDLGIATVLIEHDMRLVHGVCDYATVLDAGRVVGSGRPAELANDAHVAAAYLGGAPSGAES